MDRTGRSRVPGTSSLPSVLLTKTPHASTGGPSAGSATHMDVSGPDPWSDPDCASEVTPHPSMAMVIGASAMPSEYRMKFLVMGGSQVASRARKAARRAAVHTFLSPIAHAVEAGRSLAYAGPADAARAVFARVAA